MRQHRRYREALNLIHDQGDKLPLTEDTCLKLYRLLRGEIWDAGKYKEKNSDIIEKHLDGRSNIRFRTVSAEKTPLFMKELIDSWQESICELRFMTVNGRVGAKVFIEFLKRLLHNSERPIFLIVDGHPVHKAKVVSMFIESTQGRLQLFHLPPYSPELNPDERVWNDLKNNAVGRQRIDSPEQLHKAVISHLRFVQKTPHRVRAYFQNETTKYAA